MKHRPKFHFMPPGNWMNDPNGLISWRGGYHLFYQYNPDGAFHGNIHWGHAVSDDLVTWRHLPVALAPTPDSPDEDGCYSGVAVVDDDGVPTIIYTGVRGDMQLPCIARSTDLQMLETWEKFPGNPVIEEPPPGLDLVAYRDHSVWREDDGWYQVVGAGIVGAGGAALLYRSQNLTDWEYLHPLCVGGSEDSLWTGTMWECPDFFALGDRHVLMVSVWNEETLHYAAYFIGRYENHRFIPENSGRLDYGTSFYAPQSATDPTGRRITLGWLRDGRDEETVRRSGFAGMMSLPRELTIHEDRLLSRPVPELHALRTAHVSAKNVSVSRANEVLRRMPGDSLEIIVEFELDGEGAGDARFGMEVLRSPDGKEAVRITCDPKAGHITLDTTRFGTEESASEGPLYPENDGSFGLRVFVDESVVEVFAGTTCITECAYPARDGRMEVGVFCEGGEVRIRRLDAWRLRVSGGNSLQRVASGDRGC